MVRGMKKPMRRDPKLSRLPVALDRVALERVSAGHKTVDPMAAGFRVFQPDDIASSDD
jgi:hypothetical protein